MLENFQPGWSADYQSLFLVPLLVAPSFRSRNHSEALELKLTHTLDGCDQPAALHRLDGTDQRGGGDIGGMDASNDWIRGLADRGKAFAERVERCFDIVV